MNDHTRGAGTPDISRERSRLDSRRFTGVITMDDQIKREIVSFGQRLRHFRERSGLTQQELADRSGLSGAAIRDLEQGRSRQPRPRSVRALSVALDLSGREAAALRGSAQAVPATAARPGEDDPAMSMRIKLFGPLSLYEDSRAVPLAAGRHRLVLARLALTPNAAVSRDELIDLLWGQDVPGTAVNLVQTYVSRLRRVLPGDTPGRSHQALALVPGGYRLTVATEQLDLLVGQSLLSRARALDDGPAAFALLDDAVWQWRGVPLADVPEMHGDPLLTAIEEERIAATIRHARLAGLLARCDRALPVVRDVAGQHPLHEPLQAQLITTLAGVGQQAAALRAYEDVRRRLADDLGIDPGQDLAEAYRAVLGRPGPCETVDVRSPTTRAVPLQTPAPPADFTGRVDHLRRLRHLLGRDPRRPVPEPVTTCVISGAAGVGKTALTLRAAQLLRQSFPGGQLYVDLQGFGRLPVPPLDALAGFLRALGLNGRRIPRDEAECAALFRSVLADRRMLIVLDNAHSAAQVRPLLPGTGGNAVLVTSRRRLADLAGATTVDLSVPSAGEALDMLAASVGPARVAAEHEAAVGVVRACGRLPIALRVAGSRLASLPAWTVRAAMERLADQRHRLDLLRIGDVGVEASFDLSYAELSVTTARTFRLSALLPGSGFGVAAAARMLDEDEARVEEALHELVDGNLVQVGAEGRFRYHDLLRLYAERRAGREDAERDRSAGLGRLLDWYTEGVVAALRVMRPDLAWAPADLVVTAAFTDEAAAIGWMDTELAGMTQAIRAVAEGGLTERARQLDDGLAGYLSARRRTGARRVGNGSSVW
ncbi:BTAD domain-containing putative transcriptional regulator [Micromonospora sp. DT41]|uniref:BTAD domain-containing putative transcriptional regulator n=1 Tax=Micromonospora sp. DT41 TaxID=3393437 RepID=UPI003CF43C77